MGAAKRVIQSITTSPDGHTTYIEHRRLGHIQIARHVDHPAGRPFHLVCWGSYHASIEEALAHAEETWDAPCSASPEGDYARMEARMIRPGVFEDES